ncbi:MAG TPA: hypothetical protein VGS57_00080 [Thermoanaerobaculia bacterium]|jgi:hypothetical protein|nr:hypothetical protein [Thermoanaerobaculia bacterium]
MKRGIRTLCAIVLVGLGTSQLAALALFDDFVPAHVAGAWKGHPKEPLSEVAVSLRNLQRQAQASARPGLLTLGDLTDITGVTADLANSDVLILGTRGDLSVEPLLLEDLVTALRVGELLYMSLDPVSGSKYHQLRYGPPALAGTGFLAGLVRADYFTKSMAVGQTDSPVPPPRAVSSLYSCREEASEEPTRQNNLFFQPQVTWKRSVDGRTLRIASFVVSLTAGDDTGGIHRDFAAGFNAHQAEILAMHPRVFKNLRNLFKLHQVSQLLYSLAASGSVIDMTYWLRDYHIVARPIPSRFPEFPIRRFATYCKSPNGTRERLLDIRGGMLSRWTDDVPGLATRRSLYYADDSSLLALRPDMSFMYERWRGSGEVSSQRGTYSWGAYDTLSLVAESGAKTVLTRQPSGLVESPGTLLADVFASAVGNPQTNLRIRDLEFRASGQRARGQWGLARETQAEVERLSQRHDQAISGIDFQRVTTALDRLWKYSH